MALQLQVTPAMPSPGAREASFNVMAMAPPDPFHQISAIAAVPPTQPYPTIQKTSSKLVGATVVFIQPYMFSRTSGFSIIGQFQCMLTPNPG